MEIVRSQNIPAIPKDIDLIYWPKRILTFCVQPDYPPFIHPHRFRKEWNFKIMG